MSPHHVVSRGIHSMFHILTGFVHVGPVPVCWRGRVLLAVNCERIQEIPLRFIPRLQTRYTLSLTGRSIGQKLKVLTLQSYNPTSYSKNAYTFMANTTFNRSFLPPICFVIWIYFLFYSPWRVRIWQKKRLLWFPGGGGVDIDAILST